MPTSLLGTPLGMVAPSRLGVQHPLCVCLPQWTLFLNLLLGCVLFFRLSFCFLSEGVMRVPWRHPETGWQGVLFGEDGAAVAAAAAQPSVTPAWPLSVSLSLPATCTWLHLEPQLCLLILWERKDISLKRETAQQPALSPKLVLFDKNFACFCSWVTCDKVIKMASEAGTLGETQSALGWAGRAGRVLLSLTWGWGLAPLNSKDCHQGLHTLLSSASEGSRATVASPPSSLDSLPPSGS